MVFQTLFVETLQTTDITKLLLVILEPMVAPMGNALARCSIPVSQEVPHTLQQLVRHSSRTQSMNFLPYLQLAMLLPTSP